MRFVDLEEDPEDPDNIDPAYFCAIHYEALHALLQRPWFDRLWIRQEVALANEHAVVMCGHRYMPWADFVNACTSLRGKKADVSKSAEVQDRCVLVIELGSQTRQGGNLEYLLVVARKARCFDPRDKVYGLLSLTTEYYRQRITVNYDAPVLDVYRQVVEAEVGRGRLSILSHCDLSTWPSTLPGWPTWVPDWSNGASTSHLTTVISNGGLPAHVQYPNPHTLRATGLYVDEIQTVYEMCINPVDAPFNSEMYRLARAVIPVSDDPDVQEKMVDIFCQTICVDTFIVSGKDWRSFHDEATRHVKLLLATAGKPESALKYDNFIRRARYSCNRRSLIVTKHGKLGLAPAAARSGDAVCVLFGCPVPLVLRPMATGERKEVGGVGEKKYQVVGQCHLHGCADDEAVLGELPESVGTRPTSAFGSTVLHEYFDRASGEALPEDPRLPGFRARTRHLLRDSDIGGNYKAWRFEWLGDVTLQMLRDAGIGVDSFDLV